MPIHGISIPQTISLLAEVDNTTIQYSGAPAKLNLKAPYINSIYNNVPVGGFAPWGKTFHQIVNDVADGTTAGHLIDSTGNFVVNGVEVGDIVVDDTGGAWASVTAVNSPTDLSVDNDIFVNGDAYRIFDTPALPVGWVECNGAVINDALSRWNGLNAPDLNATPSFMRGNTESGAVGGADTINIRHAHNFVDAVTRKVGITSLKYQETTDNQLSATQSILPTYYEVVMILKIREVG